MIVGPGAATLLVRAPQSMTSLRMTVGGKGILRAEGMRPLVLRPTGSRIDLPLSPYHVVKGRDGRRVEFSRTVVSVDGQAVMRPERGGEDDTPQDAPGVPRPRPRTDDRLRPRSDT